MLYSHFSHGRENGEKNLGKDLEYCYGLVNFELGLIGQEVLPYDLKNENLSLQCYA